MVEGEFVDDDLREAENGFQFTLLQTITTTTTLHGAHALLVERRQLSLISSRNSAQRAVSLNSQAKKVEMCA